jgi:nucleolar protein 56
MLLTTTWFGTFLVDLETGEIHKKKLFPNQTVKLVERLNSIQNQEILKEEKSLVKGLSEPIMVTDSRLMGLSELAEVEGITELPTEVSLVPDEFGFSVDQYHDIVLALGKLRTQESVGKDYFIIQAVNGLDDLTQTANLLSERLHEWYGLHWPELTGMVKETEYVTLISELGDRESIINKSDNDLIKKFKPEEAVGSDFDSDDKEAVIGFAKQLSSVNTTKVQLEQYLSSQMENIAPNITHLTGAIIGARLISLTGGLARLSSVSSSTVQLLGAEKALFRHLRDGERPPKHGVIFQHPSIHNAPYWQRGKIARALAGKIAIAAKLDQHSGKFMGDELVADVNKRIKEIRKKYPNAPVKKKPMRIERRSKKTRRSGRKKRGKHR